MNCVEVRPDDIATFNLPSYHGDWKLLRESPDNRCPKKHSFIQAHRPSPSTSSVRNTVVDVKLRPIVLNLHNNLLRREVCLFGELCFVDPAQVGSSPGFPRDLPSHRGQIGDNRLTGN